MRFHLALLALLPACFLFEPPGPPPMHPAPLPPPGPRAAPASTAWAPVDDPEHDPRRDRDGDGIADPFDKCPDEAEDPDRFQDEDGCPDPDNDRDAILDRCDRCPNEPENYNGVEDTDGCPDRARIRIQEQSIRILIHVKFARGQRAPQAASSPILDEVATLMQQRPDLQLVACLGHASSDEPRPEVLAQQRAEEVRALLIKRGVEPTRLVAFSSGARRPIAPEKEPNRRVEFHLLQMGGEELLRWNGEAFEAVPSTQAPVPVAPPPSTPPGCP